jgi:glycosyltransferase involved in cell wall biosynthesis
MLVDFCLPIKNEEKILVQNLERLLSYCRQAGFSFSWRIVGVINGSTDASVKILADFKNKYPTEIDYFEVPEPGRGGALKKYWSLSSADVFSYMDADLAVNLDNLIHLVSPIVNRECEVVIGSRLLIDSRIKRSWGREIVSQSYNFISRRLLNYQVADLQCGFKAINAKTFRALQPWLQDDYWFFDTELVVLAQCLGYRVKEVPVDWQENRFDKRSSTVKVFRDSLIFLKNLWNFRKRLAKLKKSLGNV